MDAIERAVPAPQIEIIVQGRAWRQVFRNRAPLAAVAQDVHQTVSNLAQVHRALIPTRLGRREAWLDQRPLRIAQVAWIAQVVAVIAGTIFGRPHRQRLPQNQAATLESQPIHPIQYLPGQTLRSTCYDSAARKTQRFEVVFLTSNVFGKSTLMDLNCGNRCSRPNSRSIKTMLLRLFSNGSCHFPDLAEKPTRSTNSLEPISKSPEEDDKASELDEAEEV